MKTKSFLAGLLITAMAVSSCSKEDLQVTPSPTVTIASMDVESFDHLDVSDAFSVFVTFVDAHERIQIEANSNLHPYIRVESHDDRLSIELDNKIIINRGNAVLNVYVSARYIDEFTAGGAVYMELMNPLYGDDIEIHLDGASVFRGFLYADEVEAKLHGASVMEVNGSTGSFDIDASGASHMEGFGFMTADLKAHLSGASNITLTVQDELKVTASGASSVLYMGNGMLVSQDLSGASTVVRVN